MNSYLGTGLMEFLSCPEFNGNSRQRRKARRAWCRENTDALRLQEKEVEKAIHWINEGDTLYEFDHVGHDGVLEMTTPKRIFFGYRPMTRKEFKEVLLRHGISAERFAVAEPNKSAPVALLMPPR